MMLIVTASLASQRDLDSIVDYLSENAGDDVAYRFLDMLQSAYQLLAEMPGAGAPCHFVQPELLNMRMWPISRFPNYLIFYQVNVQELRIERIFHGSQDIRRIFS